MYLKELAVLKDIKMTLQEFPAKVIQNDPVTFKIELLDDVDNPISGVNSLILVHEKGANIQLDEITSGIYSCSLDTTGWEIGSYDVTLTCNKEGYRDEITKITFQD